MEDLRVRTREICKIFNINPERSKGQNFLVNEKIYDDIVAAANITLQDEVLEVGPGLGFLTVRLAGFAKRVVAVELDDQIFLFLKSGLEVSKNNNIEIVNKDILLFNPADKFKGEYKIVANLPYNITSRFLRSYLSLYDCGPSLIVLMLQEEVVRRMMAKPGDMSLLAVSVQHYASVEMIRLVKAGNFWPEPEVNSAVVRLVLHEKKYNKNEDKLFFRLVKAGFSAKRKMLKNNLTGGLQIDTKIITTSFSEAGLDLNIRAEDLSLENWYKLFAILRQFML
ncbi:MAG: 16S rRNA (adenine(1518)-N(6)/adenine(1519)-N(6))-dimethyltransferase RsmA [Patescibacteria group bacterium]|nr:16S rRNA (adenine(1518)-N(6)/adenine(1519)-N(6))-dimethyltransferase RsmA [Patescibacteria group bacterium]